MSLCHFLCSKKRLQLEVGRQQGEKAGLLAGSLASTATTTATAGTWLLSSASCVSPIVKASLGIKD